MPPLVIIGDPTTFEGKEYITRHTARAVLYRDDGRIAILHVGKYNYHKLPGGGVEAGEDIGEALKRECMEEVGAEVEIEKHIGEVIEYKVKLGGKNGDYVLQISQCYVCRITKQGTHNFTESEQENNFSHRWFTLEQAIKTLENDNPDNEEGKFILQRELAFLKNI